MCKECTECGQLVASFSAHFKIIRTCCKDFAEVLGVSFLIFLFTFIYNFHRIFTFLLNHSFHPLITLDSNWCRKIIFKPFIIEAFVIFMIHGHYDHVFTSRFLIKRIKYYAMSSSKIWNPLYLSHLPIQNPTAKLSIFTHMTKYTNKGLKPNIFISFSVNVAIAVV